MTEPTHIHDCDQCTFLGSISNENGTVDLYFHPSENPILQTAIARYSSDGPDYTSGLDFGYMALARNSNDHPLAQALLLAMEKKLISDKPFILGYDSARLTKEQDAYWNDMSGYFDGMPHDVDEMLDLEEDSEQYIIMAAANALYKKAWEQNNGPLPELPTSAIFAYDTEEEAKKHCPESLVASVFAQDLEMAQRLFSTPDRKALMRRIDVLEDQEDQDMAPR